MLWLLSIYTQIVSASGQLDLVALKKLNWKNTWRNSGCRGICESPVIAESIATALRLAEQKLIERFANPEIRLPLILHKARNKFSEKGQRKKKPAVKMDFLINVGDFVMQRAKESYPHLLSSSGKLIPLEAVKIPWSTLFYSHAQGLMKAGISPWEVLAITEPDLFGWKRSEKRIISHSIHSSRPSTNSQKMEKLKYLTILSLYNSGLGYVEAKANVNIWRVTPHFLDKWWAANTTQTSASSFIDSLVKEYGLGRLLRSCTAGSLIKTICLLFNKSGSIPEDFVIQRNGQDFRRLFDFLLDNADNKELAIKLPDSLIRPKICSA